MYRLGFLLLVASAPLLAQTSASHRRGEARASATGDDNVLRQADLLRDRARQILGVELSRKLDSACSDKPSNAEFGNCAEADEAITEHNYRAFVQALGASLAIVPPDVPMKGLPLPSKDFAAGESAWISYLDKTCEALGDTEYGASGTPTDMTMCQQNLTRQHMKDLNEIFLKQ